MNHIYRLVWSQRHSKFVVAHEKTRTSGCSSTKVSSSVASVLLSSLLVSPFAWAAPPTANTLPTGAQVTAGAAAITSSGNTMNVQQSTQRAAINWTNFSIGSNATVNFQQPNASAVVLNRVVGNEQSVINGALNANGQVFLLNSSGVLFGQGAQVNVGGLVASTLNMTDADFMAGRNTLQSTGSQASVINLGQITAADGGYVALLGNQISNQGVISARLGTAALAAGDKISLNFNGNSLVGVTIDQGTLNALVENKQAIYADGGRVYLTTQALDTVLNGVVNNTGLIQANSVGTGQNGEVILFAHGGTVDVGGTIKADGGFVETSGKQFAIQPNATVQAAEWLIDPVNITIDSTLAGTIQTALGGGNVTISTAGSNTPSTSSGQSGTDGDITVNSAITWSANNTLTLHADRNIHINADITASGASGKVALEYGQGAVAANNTSTYDFGLTSSGFSGKINLQAGQNFSTKFGSNGTAVNWTVITALGSAADVTSHPSNSLQGLSYASGDHGGSFVLGANIDASSTSTWNAGVGFQPIGYDPNGFGTSRFTGNFDGLGHTISGLTIIRSAEKNVGLFGAVLSDGHFYSNIGLTSVNLTGSQNVGSMIGGITSVNSSSIGVNISNVYSTGLIALDASSGYVGGLVGNLNSNATANSSVSNSWSSVGFSTSVNNPVVGNDFGGLFGYLNKTNISGSYATGAIQIYGATNVGGLIGEMASGGVSNSYATGTITGAANTAGGLIGLTAGVVTQSYATGTVSSSQGNLGGLIGATAVGASISNSYATGSVTGTGYLSYVGGFIGNHGGGSITGSYATGTVSTTVTTNNVTSLNTTYSSRYVGGFAGKNAATISQSYATGAVSAPYYVGGFVGQNAGGGTISQSYATGAVLASDLVGGFAGLNQSNINNSYTSSSVIGNNNRYYINGQSVQVLSGNGYIGGFAGQNSASGTISNSYSFGSVTNTASSTNFGGFVGGNLNTSVSAISNSFWDTQASNVSTDGGGNAVGGVSAVGKTTADMKLMTTYSGASWGVVQDASLTSSIYPLLRWATSGLSAGTSVWVMYSPITPVSYTLGSASATYNGSPSSLSSIWSASSIFGSSYGSWVAGTDYNFKFNNNTVTGFTNVGTYNGISVEVIKLGYSTASSNNTNGTFTINQAPVVYSVAGGSRTYGQNFTLPSPTYTGGTPTGTSTVKVYDSSNADVTSQALGGTLAVGTYTVKNTLSDTNYLIASSGNTDGTLVIVAAQSSSSSSSSSNSSNSSNSSTPTTTDVERQAGNAIHSPREITRPQVATSRESESGSTKSFSNVAVVPTDMSVAFNKEDPLALLSSPNANEPSQTVSLTDAKKMLKPSTTDSSSNGGGAGGDREVRVPVSRNSLAEIVNGGVKLPTGVEQQLFVVKAN